MPQRPLQNLNASSRGPAMRTVGLAAAALVVAASVAVAQNAGGPPGGAPAEPTAVGTIELSVEDVPYALTLPGRAVAFEEADLRPRVNGVIEEVVYQPGLTVEAGDLLFRIEDGTYAAAVAAAEASLAGSEASVATALATVERYRALEGTGVSRADLQTAEAALSQAEATQASAEAELQAVRLDLDRTEVRSPIAGVVSVAAVSVGELVTANQAEPLATVTRLDPIYVDVTESSARMMRVRDRIEAGTLSAGDAIGLRLVLETGEVYEAEGTLVTTGTNVSATTGTVDFRVQFPNPDRAVLPGQFLRVEVTLGTSGGILVPQRATDRAANGALTAFVAEDGVARQVTLTTTGTDAGANAWIVTEGLEPGDLLIVDGLNDLTDGAEIAAVAVEIDADGVVRDLEPAVADGEGQPPAEAAPGPATGEAAPAVIPVSSEAAAGSASATSIAEAEAPASARTVQE